MSRMAWMALALALALAACSGSGGGAAGDVDADGPQEITWPDHAEPSPEAELGAEAVDAAEVDATPSDVAPAEPSGPGGTEVDVTAPDAPDAVEAAEPAPDVAEETATPDVPEADEVTPESTGPDVPATCPAQGDVAALKACPQGDFEPAFLLRQVVVTYAYDQGFFVQDESGAILVYAGNADWPLPAVGSVLDLPVERTSDWNGTAEVSRTAAPTATGQQDVAALAQDLSAGTAPAEALESRLVRVTGATVVGGANTAWTVRYGTSPDVTLQVDAPQGLCVGATLTLARAVVVQDGAPHVLRSYHLASDMGAVDDAGCDLPDTANWGFELDDPSDPPPGFEKATDFFTATRSTAHKHQGAASCALTWNNNANQDLYQQLWVPATPGQDVTFHVWALDTDDDGRVRAALDFYDAAKQSLGKQYAELISVDDPTWQDLTVTAPAPADAAWVRAFVRLYDVSGGTDGTATVWIDDWTLPVP